MTKVGPVLFTGLRFIVAALVVLPFALREGRGRLFPQPRTDRLEKSERGWTGPVMMLSAAFLAGQLLQQLGIMGTTVTNAGFLTALYVIMVPILGSAFIGIGRTRSSGRRHWSRSSAHGCSAAGSRGSAEATS
jgi:drug/metabolite transporter (DMT)-like permease